MAAAAVSHPVYRTLTAGQMNAFLLLLYTLILINWRKNNGHWLAFLIAFGGMVKILPFFMGILLLERKNWKYLAEFFGWLIVLNALSIAVCGWGTHWEYINILARMGFGSSTWYEFGARFHIDPSNQSLAAFLLRNFTEHDELRKPLLNLPFTAVQVIFYGLVLAAVGYCFLLLRRLTGQAEVPRLFFFSQVMLVNFLVPTIVWDHYFMILFPVIALQAYLVKSQLEPVHHFRRFLWLLLPGFVLIIFPMIFTGVYWDYYIPAFLIFTGAAAFIFSGKSLKYSPLFLVLLLMSWMGWQLRFPYFLEPFSRGWTALIASNKFYFTLLNLFLIMHLSKTYIGDIPVDIADGKGGLNIDKQKN